MHTTITYGSAAATFARRAPHDTAIVLADPLHAAQALADVARLRRAGTPVLAALCLNDPATAIADYAVRLISAEITDESHRRQAFEELAAGSLLLHGRPVGEHGLYEINHLRTAREFLSMADGVAVRSTRERRLIGATLGLQFRHVFIPRIPDPLLIPPTGQAPIADGDIVVYAPDLENSAYMTVLAALHDTATKAIILSPQPIAATHCTVVPLEAAPAVFARARVVIDTSLSDPGASISLAGHAFGLIATTTSGADEFVHGAQFYAPGDPISVTAALARAQATRHTRRREFAALEPLSVTDFHPPRSSTQPLVSIVVPTFNRPEHVRQTLDNLARQTYRNIEVLICNDGGTPVDDIVAEYPFAVSLTLPQNGGASRAANLGFAQARGTYIGIIADDDIHYPTHIAYLVHALESSGLAIAHGNMINNLVVRGENNALLTRGYNLSHDGSIDPIEVYWAMRVAAQSLLMRRHVLAENGLWTEDYHVVTDHEFIIRVGLRYDFAHVPVVTNEMRIRDDGYTVSNRNTADYLRETEHLFAAVAPPDRPLIRERQAATFAACREAKTTRATFYPCWTPLPEPAPL